jgi:hypothetical protein
MNKELVDSLRLDAGIAILDDNRTMVAINKMGDIINSKVGFENFAELIVQECVTQLRREGERAKIQAFTGSTYKFTYMNEAANVIKRHFGIE